VKTRGDKSRIIPRHYNHAKMVPWPTEVVIRRKPAFSEIAVTWDTQS